MSQFVLIQRQEDESENGSVLSLHQTCHALIKKHFRRSTDDVLQTPNTRLLLIPSDSGKGQIFEHNKGTGEWAFICGAWQFLEGATPSSLIDYLHGNENDLKNLEGSYALGMGNLCKGTTSICSDPLGGYHVYLRNINGISVYSSSSLLLALLSETSWDDRSLAEFLASGTIYENRTLFKEIEKLPPASWRTHEGKRVSVHIYWDLHDILHDTPTNPSPEKIADRLSRSACSIFTSHSRPAFDLTGGFDSRAVVGAALHCSEPIHTNVSGPETSDDVLVAKHIADVLSLDLQVHSAGFENFENWWSEAKSSLFYTDGEYDVFDYAIIKKIHQEQARVFSVSINGSAGEAYRGYWWELLLPNPTQRSLLDGKQLAKSRFVTNDVMCGLVTGFDKESLIDHVGEVIRKILSPLSDVPRYRQMDYIYLHMRMQRWQGRISSSTVRIWPCLSPLAFRPVLELGLRNDYRHRKNNRLMRRIIEGLNPKLARIPMTDGCPALPIRPTTLHLFLPYLTDTSRRIFNKLQRMITKTPYRPPPTSGADISMILKHEEGRSFVSPEDMRVTAFLNEDALSSALDVIQKKPHIYRRELGRIVTLEMVSRLLEKN